MNKIFPIASACLTSIGLAVAAAPAWSQGVTLSGVVDLAARQVSNEGLASVKSLVSGSNSTSRLLVRGTEDLGGGLSAGFHLEHGLNATSGTQASTTQFWDRRSTVSVASQTLGEIRAGRDFVPSYSNWSRFDPFGYVGVASSSNFVSATPRGPIRSAFGTNLNTTVRANSALQWLLPSGLGGLEGGVLVAPGAGGSSAAGQAKVLGLRLGYAQGPVVLSAATTRSENDLTRVGGAFQDHVLGGSYNFGAARVSAAWRRFKQADANETHLMVGVWVPVGQGEVRLSWHRLDAGGRVGTVPIDANDARQIGLGYVHNLSNRTALYATLARLDNQGTSTLAIPGGATGLAAGRSSTGYEAGVRHSF